MHLTSLLSNQFNFTNSEHNKITYSEIMEMYFWKFEEFIQRLNEYNEERSREEKKANDEQNKQQQQMSTPKMNIPKMNIPKLR